MKKEHKVYVETLPPLVQREKPRYRCFLLVFYDNKGKEERKNIYRQHEPN